MIVGPGAKNSKIIEPLSNKDAAQSLGVVVPLNDAPIALVPQTATDHQVLIVSSGTHFVLVSDERGAVCLCASVATALPIPRLEPVARIVFIAQ
ncbi:hypothetical protein COY17_00075 [Candidatus Saccharibacteria bacterium CG_4_10_14_0_2_um_filter_52_9]|nr:MAG: hypothetical protein COY17_00075 [Candidatus Saccharibacteria bacterium CG_4_10_14_0_2_um_filter_52_9]